MAKLEATSANYSLVMQYIQRCGSRRVWFTRLVLITDFVSLHGSDEQ